MTRPEHGASWTRRETLNLLSSLSAAAAIGAVAEGDPVMADTTPAAVRPLPPAYRGEHQVKPLPFDPAKLTGLSEKLISSHHQNNAYHIDYGANAKGYVDAFFQNVRWDEVDRRIRAAGSSTSPPSL